MMRLARCLAPALFLLAAAIALAGCGAIKSAADLTLGCAQRSAGCT